MSTEEAHPENRIQDEVRKTLDAMKNDCLSKQSYINDGTSSIKFIHNSLSAFQSVNYATFNELFLEESNTMPHTIYDSDQMNRAIQNWLKEPGDKKIKYKMISGNKFNGHTFTFITGEVIIIQYSLSPDLPLEKLYPFLEELFAKIGWSP